MGTAILTRARNLVRTKTPGDWPTGRQVYQHFAAPLVCKITSLAGKGKICKKVFRYTFSLFGLVQFAGPDRPCALRKIICRNTPTCVGKTAVCPGASVCPAETPPRAWGRLVVGHVALLFVQKHPHVRGEDKTWLTYLFNDEETPPRAWGRRSTRSGKTLKIGNTPTCVGKTG